MVSDHKSQSEHYKSQDRNINKSSPFSSTEIRNMNSPIRRSENKYEGKKEENKNKEGNTSIKKFIKEINASNKKDEENKMRNLNNPKRNKTVIKKKEDNKKEVNENIMKYMKKINAHDDDDKTNSPRKEKKTDEFEQPYQENKK